MFIKDNCLIFNHAMKKVIYRNRHNQEKIINVDKLQFRPSVYAVIIKDNQVLLSRQWDGYDFPGGGIDKGETIMDALKREVHEEVGIGIDAGGLITCDDDFYMSKKGIVLHSILMYYAVDVFEGEPNINNLDTDEREYISGFDWIDIDKLSDVKFYNGADSVAIVQKATDILYKV